MKELELKYGCNPNQKPARLSMDQGHSNPTGFRLLLCPLSHSCEHGIGGCLRWQEKSNPSQMKTIHHNLSSRECRLRFPLTHKSF